MSLFGNRIIEGNQECPGCPRSSTPEIFLKDRQTHQQKLSVRMKRKELHEAMRKRVNSTVEGSSIIVLCNTHSRGRGNTDTDLKLILLDHKKLKFLYISAKLFLSTLLVIKEHVTAKQTVQLFLRSFFFDSDASVLYELLRYCIYSLVKVLVKVQANSRFPKQVHGFTARGEEKRRRETRRFAAESRSSDQYRIMDYCMLTYNCK
ncbi:hypothetical protein G5I_08715 [Acromyrmex echinatior]|uniref:Uncharacterized protein n=1 Tax=Acromyrmex echinatior TaxID=103372 RepID=F4WS99_ACREC|nr:hypothetical protein G5I_08715 [Acromyrmex echinatior]